MTQLEELTDLILLQNHKISNPRQLISKSKMTSKIPKAESSRNRTQIMELTPRISLIQIPKPPKQVQEQA